MTASNVHSSSGSSINTGVLHSNANIHKETLLNKLGGTHMLHTAVDHFYDKLIADPELQPFFAQSDVKLLKWHQFNFMSIAFAHVPEDFDVAELILKRHARFFAMGMNEKHFDLVIEHFRKTLQELDIDTTLIQEAVDMLMPVRPVFQQGAANAVARQRAEVWNHYLRTAAVAALVGYVVVHWIRNHHRRSI
jgi:hemoglobin